MVLIFFQQNPAIVLIKKSQHHTLFGTPPPMATVHVLRVLMRRFLLDVKQKILTQDQLQNKQQSGNMPAQELYIFFKNLIYSGTVILSMLPQTKKKRNIRVFENR